MPDRYIGHRTAEGDWKWEESAPQQPKKRQDSTLILLVVAGGILTSCLLIGVVLLAAKADGNGSAGTLPASDSAKQSYFGVWNLSASVWQTSDLDLADEGAKPEATFLLNVEDSEGSTIEVKVAFQCTGEGRVSLTPLAAAYPDEAKPALASPGPGRPRPDTTALGGSIAIWGATFTVPPTWEPEALCSDGQTLKFTVAAKTSKVSVIWNARLEAPTSEDAAKGFTAEASVIGTESGKISVASRR